MTLRFAGCLALGVATSLTIAIIGCWRGETRKWKMSDEVAVASDPAGIVLLQTEAQISEMILLARVYREYGASVQPTEVVLRGPRAERIKRVAAFPISVHDMKAPVDFMIEYHIGWPVACLWGTTNEVTEGTDMSTFEAPTHLFRAWPRGPLPAAQRHLDFWFFPPHTDSPCRFIATGILPLGMAANTLMFGTAWAVPVLAPGFVRRRTRSRNGRCLGCGYHLAGLAPGTCCPECGHPR